VTEIANLNQKATQPKTSCNMLVRQLQLFLGAKRLLRCNKRIQNAPLNEVAKFPYMLPSKHPYHLCTYIPHYAILELEQHLLLFGNHIGSQLQGNHCYVLVSSAVRLQETDILHLSQHHHYLYKLRMFIRSPIQGCTSVEHCMCDMEGRRLKSTCVYLHVPQLMHFTWRLSKTLVLRYFS